MLESRICQRLEVTAIICRAFGEKHYADTQPLQPRIKARRVGKVSGQAAQWPG